MAPHSTIVEPELPLVPLLVDVVPVDPDELLVPLLPALVVVELLLLEPVLVVVLDEELEAVVLLELEFDDVLVDPEEPLELPLSLVPVLDDDELEWVLLVPLLPCVPVELEA